MHLVLDIGDKGEHRAVRADRDLAAVGYDGACAVAVVLDHAEHRDRKPRLPDDGQYGADLSLAAVEQDQIGQSAEAAALAVLLRLFVFLDSAGQHLGHRAVVVLTGKGSDLELAVRGFQRAGVLKHHHARNVVLTRKVADIVALDVRGYLLKPQKRPQLLQHAELFSRDAALLTERLKGVGAAHLHQLLLYPALRNGQIHAPALLICEPLLCGFGILDLAVQRDAGGDLMAESVVAQEELRAEIPLVVHVVDQEILGIVQAAVGKAQNGRRALVALSDHGDDVQLVDTDIHDLLLIAQLLHRGDLVAQACRAFKVQRVRGGEHPLLQQLHHACAVAREELQRRFHPLVVVVRLHASRAGRTALLDVEIQAGTLFAEVLREPPAAGRQSEDLVRLLHRGFDVPAVFERPDVARSVVRLLQDVAEAAVRLVRHADIAVALVVLEQDVVFRGMLLDQRAFQYQALELGIGDDVGEVVHVVHHPPHLFGVVVLRAEVLADAVFQLLRLADVDDLARLVLHDIYARLQGKRHRLCPQLLHLRIQALTALSLHLL